jgi:hypothetical protein
MFAEDIYGHLSLLCSNARTDAGTNQHTDSALQDALADINQCVANGALCRMLGICLLD